MRELLKTLPDKMRKKVQRNSMKRAAALLEGELESTSEWADDSGELRRSIKTKSRNRKGKIGFGIVGNYYGRFLEFGWIKSRRPTTRAARAERKRIAGLPGNESSIVPPRSWIRPPFERNKRRIMKMILQDLRDGAEEAAAKMNRKTRRRK